MSKVYLSPENWKTFYKSVGCDQTSEYYILEGMEFVPEIRLLYKLECDGQSLEVYKWPEGYVVWANGKIIYKSWET